MVEERPIKTGYVEQIFYASTVCTFACTHYHLNTNKLLHEYINQSHKLGVAHGINSRSNVALVHESLLVRSKLTGDGVPNTLVVEQHQIAGLPRVGIDVLGINVGSHDSIQLLSSVLELQNLAVLSLNLVDTTAVGLQMMLAGDGVGPDHGQSLDLAFLPFGQLFEIHLLALADHSQTIISSLGRRDEDVRVGSVDDGRFQSQLLVLWRQQLECIGARHKAGGGLGQLELVAGVGVLDLLVLGGRGHVDSEQSGADRGKVRTVPSQCAIGRTGCIPGPFLRR